MYSYAFVEEVFVEPIGNVHHDRSSGALEVGYFITPSIGVRFLAVGSYTHGGLAFRRGADYQCVDGCDAADPIFLHHDQIEHSSAIVLGGGLSYQLTGTVDLYGNYFRTVQGRGGGHKIDHGLSFGFSWGFSPKQVIRSMFGPRTPVGETPVQP
jgi:hypothetical protein